MDPNQLILDCRFRLFHLVNGGPIRHGVLAAQGRCGAVGRLLVLRCGRRLDSLKDELGGGFGLSRHPPVDA